VAAIFFKFMGRIFLSWLTMLSVMILYSAGDIMINVSGTVDGMRIGKEN
jgi:hypothetical protein